MGLERTLWRYSGCDPEAPGCGRADRYPSDVLALASRYCSVGSSEGWSDVQRVVDVARRYLGVPYVFGGTNREFGLGCSALVQLVYGQLGLHLPRTAQQQYNATVRIAADELRPGDLVFFAGTYPDPHDWITHVGIYLGGGQQINAPTTGQVVSIQPVFSGFCGAHFVAGGRLST